MVLLSASICTKTGKPLVARQFMEISRSRVEGLLAAFPKLRNADEQHTFVETESVRYVYRPMEQLYMVLITTKNSNILQDLETLRLFSRVVPEICRSMNEVDVSAKAFDLIFAFDEIIALGYPENVNLSQVRTYTEMHSHDEAIYKMVKENKEREAKDTMKRKAKELQMQKRMRERMGGPASGGYSGMSSGSSMASTSVPEPTAYKAPASVAAPAPAKKKAGRGMKLGGKAKTNDFVDALIAEGEQVAPEATNLAPAAAAAATQPAVEPTESIHVKIDEKIMLRANRDGGLEEMEVKGTMFVSVFDDDKAKLQLRITKDDGKEVPFQTHPNVDKKAFANENIIRLKKVDRPFPTNSELGVVKWRITSTDDAKIPLSINCWPTVNGDGSCEVNIEYTLNDEDLELENVAVTIPLPTGSGSPVVASVDGEYHHNPSASVLTWTIPVINKDNDEGSMEFSVPSNDADDFFPVLVDFSAPKTFAGISIDRIETIDGDELKFSDDIRFSTESYEIV